MLKIDEIGDVHNRIDQLVDHFYKGNKAAFGRGADIQSGVLAGIIGGRKNKPSFDVLQKLLTAYPSVNPTWLLFGRGPMLQNEESKLVAIEYQAQAPVSKEAKEILDLVRSEMAKLITQKTRPQLYEFLKEEISDEMARNRARYALELETEAAGIRKEIESFGNAQASEKSKLEYRLKEIERGIYLAQNEWNKGKELPPQ